MAPKSSFTRAVLKLAKVNPEFRQALKAEISKAASANKALADAAKLVDSKGYANADGKLLGMIARSEPAGIEVPRGRVEGLTKAGLAVYGLDPRGGYRAHITGAGLDALGAM